MSENLWALREQKRLSVATLASRAGLPIGLILEYESGQRSVEPRHLNRLARALYVEESEIRLHSDPRPGAPPLERQGRREETRAPLPPTPAPVEPPPPASVITAPPRPRERAMRGPRSAAEPRPPAPVRASQLAHLRDLLQRLGRPESELQSELGKPLTALDRLQASKLLVDLQPELRSSTAERHRAYLPEAVDQYELKYLTGVRDAGGTLTCKLFDDSTVVGTLTGFSPYALTLQCEDGSETTVNKLAIVSYTRALMRGDALNGKELRQ